MNTSYKKCDIKPWNIPDHNAQKAMIHDLEIMNEKSLDGSAVMLFSDAVHQLHTTINGYAVQFKGKKHTKVLSSNTWRRRFTVVWAVNPVTCHTSFVTTDGMCNQWVIKLLLDQVYIDYKDEIIEWKKIYFILDNARYQRAKDVQEYAKVLKIDLCFLPPYCPHLNLIERLRKRLKKKIRNKYISEFSEFCSVITDIIWSTRKSISELTTLLSINFWII